MRWGRGLFAALFLLPATLAASTRVRIAYYFDPGLCERRSDGALTGAMLDYFVQLAKLNDWEIEPVYCTYDEALARLERNEIDLVGGVTATAERRKAFSFPVSTAGEYRPHLFVRPNSPFVPGRPQTWQNIKIGIGPGSQMQASLEKYLTSRGVSYKLCHYRDSVEATRAFKRKEVDAIYALGAETFLSSKVLVSFPAQPTYICVPKARKQLLKQVEDGIQRLQVEQPDFESRVKYRHLPVTPRVELDFTPSEQAWLASRIASGSPIVVDLTPDILPFKGWNEAENRPIGMICNILDEVGRRTGLTFQYIKPDSEQMARTRFLLHEVDFWATLGAPVDDLPGYSGGITLASLPKILITRHRRNITNLSTVRVAVPSWDLSSQRDYRSMGVSNLVVMSKLDDVLKEILDGKIDTVAVPLPQALMACQNMNILNQVDFRRMESRLLYPQQITLVPAASVDSHLVSIIDKCVGTFSAGEISAFMYHALTGSLAHSFLTERQWMFLVAGLSILVLLLFTAMFLFYNLRLTRALVRAKAGERARTQFLATISHEIRTPLNAVIGFADFLTQPDLTVEKIRGYAHGVFRSSHVLLDLINDVLDLSKIEAGRVDMRQGVSDFAALRREFLTIFAAKAAQQKIHFAFIVPDGFPCLRLSPLHLRQILLNLLGNAVKFTVRGSVECTVRMVAGMPGRQDLEIAVSDTGIGITKDRLAQIFDPFVQDISTRGGRVYEGTGLGLPIVKRLAEAAGGTVSVESTPGVGSTFTLRIPNVEAAKSVAEPPPALPPVKGKGAFPKSVLLVDDVALNLIILKVHLSHLGVEKIRTAASGDEALRLLTKEPADLVLTDLWMPVMDGAALARRIRENAAFAKCRIVAVTADVGSENTFDMSVFDEILTKPVTKEKLQLICGAPQSGAESSARQP